MLYIKDEGYKWYYYYDDWLYFERYSKRNKNNIKKCILHLIEKKSNNFLNLRLYKSDRIIGHTSGGQALSRAYNNAKRQKKGVKVLSNLLERKFKKKIKLFKLKNLYLISNKYWNYRISYLTRYWVWNKKLGIKYLSGLIVGYNIAQHSNIKKGNKRRK